MPVQTERNLALQSHRTWANHVHDWWPDHNRMCPGQVNICTNCMRQHQIFSLYEKWQRNVKSCVVIEECLHLTPLCPVQTIMENEYVQSYKYNSCFNRVESSGNDLLMCGNPTWPASLVTTTTSKLSSVLLNSQKKQHQLLWQQACL